MEWLCLTGSFSDKLNSKKLKLFLPSVKQPVNLPISEPERSIEEKRRSLINEDKGSISKLTMEAVNRGKEYWFHRKSHLIREPGALNSILRRHPFPLGQGPTVIPLDNDAAQKVVGEGYPHPSGSGKWICPPIEQLPANEVFANRTMFTHEDSQKCHEWNPSLTGNSAWDPDSINVHMYNLQDLQDPIITVQGPASDVQEHQKMHLVFHTRCRYCRYDLRPFERRNIVNVEEYGEAERLLKWVDQKTCSYCLLKCKNKTERKKNEETVHENNGKFKCEICGKTYSNKNSLQYHISNKHDTDKEKLCCDLCLSNFTTDANLQRHIKTIHKDPTQKCMFQCEKCDKQFSSQDNLNAHAREKHYDVNANVDFVENLENLLQNKCDQCDKVFKRKNMLQRYVRTVHREAEEKKQYKCSKCESKFSRPDNLKRHVTQKHVHTE